MKANDRIPKSAIQQAQQYAQRELRKVAEPRGGYLTARAEPAGPDAKDLKTLVTYVSRYEASQRGIADIQGVVVAPDAAKDAMVHLAERATNFADHGMIVGEQGGQALVVWDQGVRGDHVIDRAERKYLSQRDEAYQALLNLAARQRR